MKLAFLKKKRTYVFGVIGLIVIMIIIGQIRAKNAPIEYETFEVTRGELIQSVEATGKIESATDLDLHFEVGGTIGQIDVTEGQEVKTGDTLVSLRLAELNAAVAQAQANLNQKLAGATPEDIKYYEAAVDLARATLEQTRADVSNSISVAEAAVETAQNNLKLAEGGEDSQIVDNAYELAVASLKSAVSVMDNGLSQADNILGMDNVLANDDFEDYLAAQDISELIIAKDKYNSAKGKINEAKNAISPLYSSSDHAAVDTALTKAEAGLNEVNTVLLAVRDVLNATPPIGSLTQTILDTKKTTIETASAGVSTSYNTIISKKQGITDAKNSYTTFLIAYNKAVQDLNNTRATAESTIQIKEAAHNQALANLESKKNPPREVDVAAYRAALAQAVANRDKAILKSPIDGVVAKISKKIGEQISVSETMVKMLSPRFEISVDVPETDVAKITTGDIAEITLDAFGNDVIFTGTITGIDLTATEIQDVVYYQVNVTLDTNGEEAIKSGMTADIVFATEKLPDVLAVPSRSISTNDQGDKVVKVLVDGQSEERVVSLGIRGDDGLMQINSGLSEGDKVILGEVSK